MLVDGIKTAPLNFHLLRATQLKVIYAMKEIPSIEWIIGLFDFLAGYLKSGSYILASYSSVCLEALLTLSVSDVEAIHEGNHKGIPHKILTGSGAGTVNDKLDFLVK